MDFSWSKDQSELREAAEAFAREQLNVELIRRDREGIFNRDGWNRCAEFGIQGLCVPSDYGGSGFDALTAVGVLERLGYGCRDNGLVFSINAHMWTMSGPLATFGTPAQRAKYLPGLCDGTLIGGNAMSEPGSGSDAHNMSTVAERRDGRYVINGSKTYVTNGPVADVLMVFAMIDKSKGAHGISAFLVDTKTPGVSVVGKIDKMGLRTSPMAQIYFDQCEVAAELRLGDDGKGHMIFAESMLWERACILASAVGSMERLLERSVRYAQERRQFGSPIGSFQYVAGRIVDMKMRLEASRHQLYHSAWLLSKGRNCFLEAAMTKLQISEAWCRSCEDAIQIHGGSGYTVDYELERELRDAIGSRLYSGTSEMQRNIIAGLLGL
jgi:alkylation response protein AidB-like acyl-CoA dehydrogenase